MDIKLGGNTFGVLDWVLEMVSLVRHMVGLSYVGREDELMKLFIALEKERMRIPPMSPSRSGGKLMRELKALKSSVNYDGKMTTSRKSRCEGRTLIHCK